MNDVRLPDGTWVTTPMAAGSGMPRDQCAGTCAWEDFGPPTPPEVGGPVPIQLQRCPACGRVRGRYLGNPHPEVTDDGGTDE